MTNQWPLRRNKLILVAIKQSLLLFIIGCCQSPSILLEVEQSPDQHGQCVLQASRWRAIYRLSHRCRWSQTPSAQGQHWIKYELVSTHATIQHDDLLQLVLSACSSYFEDLFMSFNEKNQIVVLKDTRYCDVQALLEFMYKGEINVPQVILYLQHNVSNIMFIMDPTSSRTSWAHCWGQL